MSASSRDGLADNCTDQEFADTISTYRSPTRRAARQAHCQVSAYGASGRRTSSFARADRQERAQQRKPRHRMR
eukprot:6197834-Pleurochrysis_carterae.AAC.2